MIEINRSKVTVAVIFIFFILQLFSRFLIFLFLFRVFVDSFSFLLNGQLVGGVSVFVSGESSFFLWLKQSLIKLIFGLKIIDLLFFKFDSDFFHCLFGFAEFFFFDFVKLFELALQIIQVSVFGDVYFLETREFLFQAFIFLHESWFNSH